MSCTAIGPVNAVTANGFEKNVVITCQDGLISTITPQPHSTPARLTAVPSFIDLHIHGMGGYGPQQGTAQALLHLSDVLARQGVYAFCPTLYCAQPPHMARQVAALLPAFGQEKGARLLGFHLEGPFISPQKPGVMKPQDIAPANLDDFKKIYEAAQGHIAIVTLAPELENIEPVIQFCLANGITVQAGHTNATYAQMQRAFEMGVRRVTHLGNAMRGFHHREPGVLGAVLAKAEISCEVIADGKHVHPALLTLLKQVKPISHISAITDALLPTGQTTGPFYANGEEVVLQEGVWKRKSDQQTAGSCLTMAQALGQLLRAGYSWQEAVCCTGQNAARLLNLPLPEIKPGAPARFAVLDEHFNVTRTVGL